MSETSRLRVSKWGALRFENGALEQAYRSTHQSQVILQTGIVSAVACALVVFYIYVDDYYVDGYALQFVYASRVVYLIPALLAWAVMSYTMRDRPGLYYRLVQTSAIPGFYLFIVLVWLSDGEGYLYASVAQTQVNVLLTILMRFPMYFVLPHAALCTTAFVLVMTRFELPMADLLIADIPVVSVTLFSLVVAYKMDYDSRRTFLIEREYYKALEEEKRAEQNRVEWLQNLSRFLKHEFRNALLGVSTSLDRIAATDARERIPVYVQRARDSLSFMQRLLERTADAASVSSALVAGEPESFDLSGMVEDIVVEYREANGEHRIVAEISGGIEFVGEPDRVRQLLEKLLTNAIEHSDAAEPIIVALRKEAGSVVVAVENRGDRLEDDIESLSRLFRSTKQTSSNFGLGLYVSRKIVEHHGGTLSAERLEHPPGARFLARLPLSSASEP